MTTDFRAAILRQLRRQKKSRYWLAEEVQLHMSRNTVYAYLRGQNDIRSDHLARLLAAVDLEIRPRRPR